MRIATSSIFDQQTAAIDNLTVQQALFAQELSSGKALNQPSDNPTVIAQDLAVRSEITVDNQVSQNLTNLQNQLTSADSALNSLTNILQSAQNIAIQGASDVVTPAQRQALAAQVNQLLGEAIGLANTQYGGAFLFAGTKVSTTPPVQAQGNPPTGVTTSVNEQPQTQTFSNGQTLQTSVTLQQAFNYQSADGSPDVFQTLITLRDSLQNSSVVDESAAQVNVPGQAITAGTTVTQLEQTGPTPPALMTVPLKADSSGNVSISIASSSAPNGVTITFVPGDTIASIVGKINAQTAATGVTASFDTTRQRLILSSSNGAFLVQDVPSAGAGNTGNFVEAFGLQSQASVVNTLSRQIGDIQHVLQVALGARSMIGAAIQQLGALGQATSSAVLNDTTVQSNLEDADIPKVISQFSQTQTALQAAYATTTRLESKTLFDYLT